MEINICDKTNSGEGVISKNNTNKYYDNLRPNQYGNCDQGRDDLDLHKYEIVEYNKNNSFYEGDRNTYQYNFLG